MPGRRRSDGQLKGRASDHIAALDTNATLSKMRVRGVFGSRAMKLSEPYPSISALTFSRHFRYFLAVYPRLRCPAKPDLVVLLQSHGCVAVEHHEEVGEKPMKNFSSADMESSPCGAVRRDAIVRSFDHGTDGAQVGGRQTIARQPTKVSFQGPERIRQVKTEPFGD